MLQEKKIVGVLVGSVSTVVATISAFLRLGIKERMSERTGKFVSGFAWGLGAGLAISVVFLLAVLVLMWFENVDGPPDREAHDLSGYSVVNSSSRLVPRGEFSQSEGVYVLVAGEVRFDTPPDTELISVTATLRNAAGGFVDHCSENYPVSAISDQFLQFKVHCRHISQLNEFANYKFEVSGYK